MRSKIWSALGSVVSCALAAASGWAQPVAATPLPTNPAAPASRTLEASDLEAWLDGRVPYALTTGDIAGMTIVVVKDGKVLLEKGYGYADVANKTPMDPMKTMVRPGSTSKLFTWTAVMQLVEAGKLDLDRDVNGYLDFKIEPKGGRPITLRDLMNHRAGFEEGLKDILVYDPRILQTTEHYLKTHPRPMLFAPGDVPAYSNYGAALAGYIVQRVSGERFETYIEKHILAPLGMTHTTFELPLPEKFRGQMSQGYRTASGAPQPYELVTTAPAGSAATTADDMSRFMLAHLQNGQFSGHAILSPATTQLMHTPSEAALPGFSTMAHGFMLSTDNGRTVIAHGGDTLVFHTEMDLVPQEGVGIFYTFNSRGAQDAVYGARKYLFDGFMDRYFPGPPLSNPATLASATQDAQKIAGNYWSSRRVEHGFLSLLYVLKQTQIVANENGTVTMPDALGLGDATFREIGPQLWRSLSDGHEIALTHVAGVKTIVDSEDPDSVLQTALRSIGLNMPIMLGSFAILAWTLLLWVLTPLLQQRTKGLSGLTPDVRRLRLIVRLAAAVSLAYLIGWYMLVSPILSTNVQVYTAALDPIVSAMECAGVLAIVAAAVGVWGAWRMIKLKGPWLSRIWTVFVAAALVGVVWIGFIGNLISFNLNY